MMESDDNDERDDDDDDGSDYNDNNDNKRNGRNRNRKKNEGKDIKKKNIKNGLKEVNAKMFDEKRVWMKQFNVQCNDFTDDSDGDDLKSMFPSSH